MLQITDAFKRTLIGKNRYLVGEAIPDALESKELLDILLTEYSNKIKVD